MKYLNLNNKNDIKLLKELDKKLRNLKNDKKRANVQIYNKGSSLSFLGIQKIDYLEIVVLESKENWLALYGTSEGYNQTMIDFTGYVKELCLFDSGDSFHLTFEDGYKIEVIIFDN